MKRLLIGLFLFHVPVVALAAQEAPTATLPKDFVSKFQWRCIGPANMGGRIVELAVYEKDPTTFWAATASGGLLKTTNNGITFEHQFDKETTVSIGSVCVAQSDPNIVWVGTGEENPRNSVSYGDGVYKSVDGGKTWKNMGLKESFQIGCIQVHPTNPDIVYVGALGRLYGPNEQRGLFKTTDGGKTWNKIHFVDAKTGVIDIQMHPKDPDTLIFATYERQRDGFDGNAPAKKIAPGSGLWRTTDGGQTIEKLTNGLPTCNMGRIGIDYYRKNPDIVYAIIETEMMGKPGANVGWSGIERVADAETGAKVTSIVKDSPAAEAGLKAEDIILRLNDTTVLKGRKLVEALTRFEVGEKVSVEYARAGKSAKTDIVLKKRPKRTAQNASARGGRSSRGRSRSPRPRGASATIRFGGRLGGQGANLQDFQGENGFEHGGLFVSEDSGSSWRRINSIDPRPMYFSQFRVDPTDNKIQYVMGISGMMSKDGGKTFSTRFTGGVHADHHAMWIDPNNSRHIILGCDGGIYVTYDRAKNWDHVNNTALGQFYHVAVGPRRDYWVYGGLQDNGTWGAPHRAADGRGVLNEDWIRIGGGDGFVVQVDPNDPHQIYYESQNGNTRRRHLVTGESARIRPVTPRRQRGEQGQRQQGQRQRTRYRFNWQTPFILSHHNSRIYYTAGNYVFRSLDRGNDLRPISPEITLTDKGSGSAVAESPRNPDVLYAGTTDGGLWGTRKGTHGWVNLREVRGEPIGEANDASATDASAKKDGGPREPANTDDPVPFAQLVPTPMWISCIEASRYKEGRVYVAVDGHRSDDDSPHVLVSEDYGQTWRSLNANLPRGSTRIIREDRVNQNLLYCGTEFGLYVSVNRGKEWVRFHNNLPTVAIHEVAQHRSCGDIVVATHGRSLWSLDVTPLRQMTAKGLAQDVLLCKPSEVILWKRKPSRGSTGGARRFVGRNPSTQAEIFFTLKKKPRTLTVTIHDQKGDKIRDLTVKPAAGLHKVSWNLRRNPPAGQSQMSREEMIRRFRSGRFRGGFGARSAGVGTYKVVVTADGQSQEAEIKVSPDPND